MTTNAGSSVPLGVNGTDLTDTATLAGGDSPTGTMTFHLFSDANCSTEVAGSPVTTPVNGNGQYVSPVIHVNAAGTYHWVANYGGDQNNLATQNGCNGTNENVVVNLRSPTVTTNAGGNVVFGANGNDLSDSATLSGGTTNISGTITFQLYSDTNCAVEVSGSPVTKPVNGNAVYASPTIHVSAAGTYRWIANYGGDANNNATTNTCNGANESVTVQAPGIKIEKDPATQTIVSGSTATFTIKVTNTGDVTLTAVHVNDALTASCQKTSAQLGANARSPPVRRSPSSARRER